MLRATIDEPVPLHLQVADGRTDLYARAKIYTAAGGLNSTVSLPHIAEGLYGTLHTFTSEGYFSAIYQLFEDAGFSTPADYDFEAETFEACSDKLNIKKILGLEHNNTVEDLFVYDGAGNLTNVRVRNYDTEANALAAKATSPANGTIGLLFTWNITAQYTGGKLSLYAVVED